MGSTKLVNIENTLTILLFNILNTPALGHNQDSKKAENNLENEDNFILNKSLNHALKVLNIGLIFTTFDFFVPGVKLKQKNMGVLPDMP